MTIDLHERLADLAGRTPPGSPPPDLWVRGVRRRRMAAAGRVAVAVVLAFLVGVGGWTWHQTRPIQPADTHGSPHLPDRFYAPSPWMSSFDGPPGPLVAIGTAERKSLFHTGDDLYGVTASSGQYGFLDLPPYVVTRPDLGETRAPALSPDGRRIAVWTTGTPSGSPNTKLEDGLTITGVAVYDATTGRTVRTSVATEHGLSPSTLQWVDDETLVIGIDQASFGDANENSCCQGHWQGLAIWPVGDPAAPTALPSNLPLFIDDETTSAAQGRIVFADSGRLVHVIDPQSPVTDRRLLLSRPVDRAVLSPDGRRLAFVSGIVPHARRFPPGVLYLADVPDRVGAHSRQRLDAAPLSDVRTYERVVAWTDADHVAVLSSLVLDHQVNYRLDSVDVRSGSRQTLVLPSTEAGATSPAAMSLAVDLLSAPSVHASPPPRPWSHRGIAIGLLVVMGLLGLVLWGIRVRRA